MAGNNVGARVGVRVGDGVGGTVVHSGLGAHCLVTVVAADAAIVSSTDETANIPPSMIVMLSPPDTGNATSYMHVSQYSCVHMTCPLRSIAASRVLQLPGFCLCTSAPRSTMRLNPESTLNCMKPLRQTSSKKYIIGSEAAQNADHDPLHALPG